MRPNRFAAALFILLSFCCALQSFSQSQLNADNFKNVKVDALSDAEIKAYYQRASAAGFTQEQLVKMAGDRGMPAEEIEKQRARLENIGNSRPAIKRNDTSQVKKVGF